MFFGILLRDPARDFGVEFESLRHREIFQISTRADKKTIGSHLKSDTENPAYISMHNFDKMQWMEKFYVHPTEPTQNNKS